MNLKGIGYAVLAALCFGVMPILTKQLYGSTGVDPLFFLMIRYTLAAVFIWSFIALTPRNRRETGNIDRSGLLRIFLTSCCYIIVTTMYFIALKYIDASLNSLLVFTFPIFTPFFNVLIFKEKLHWLPISASLVGFFGCAMVIGGYHIKGVPFESLGIGLGVMSGIIYALYTLMGQKVTARIAPLMVTAINLSFVAVFFIIMRAGWLWKNPSQPGQVYLVAAIIAIISTILANVFYFEAIRALGAVKAGIFSSFEPFFTALLAVIFLHEKISIVQWFGAIFIISGMVMIQRPLKRDVR